MAKENNGNGDKVFVKIRNQEIFTKLCQIHDDLIGIKQKVKTHDKLIWGVLIVLAMWIVKFVLVDSPQVLSKLVG